MTIIRRGFVDVGDGQVHYRTAGDGRPLIACHACPGSAKQLEGLIGALAGRFRVIAPDMPGLGDSTPHPKEAPEAADLAQSFLAAADGLGLDRFAVYGSHTGAALATELAIAAPERVSCVVLDGMTVFTADERADMLEHYAHPFPADLDGAYLPRVFMFCRDQFVFFPWYRRDRAHVRGGGLAPPDMVADWVLEVLKARTSYHLGYRAAFRHDGHARGALIAAPVLAMASADDPLFAGTEAAAADLADGRFLALPTMDAPDHRQIMVDAIVDFVGRHA